MKRWRQLKQTDRMRALVVAVALLVGLYGLIVYPALHGSLSYSENMISRRLDRIAKRAEIDKNKEVEGNPAPLQQTLRKLEQNLEQIERQTRQAEQQFVPLTDYDAQQQLQLEIVNLARQTGLHLKKIGDPQARSGAQAAIGQYVQRPSMALDAESDYWSLVRFLEGLQSLSYYTAVIKLAIDTPRSARSTRAGNNVTFDRLSLQLEMIL